jgi:hypothetical protein
MQRISAASDPGRLGSPLVYTAWNACSAGRSTEFEAETALTFNKDFFEVHSRHSDSQEDHQHGRDHRGLHLVF